MFTLVISSETNELYPHISLGPFERGAAHSFSEHQFVKNGRKSRNNQTKLLCFLSIKPPHSGAFLTKNHRKQDQKLTNFAGLAGSFCFPGGGSPLLSFYACGRQVVRCFTSYNKKNGLPTKRNVQKIITPGAGSLPESGGYFSLPSLFSSVPAPNFFSRIFCKMHPVELLVSRDSNGKRVSYKRKANPKTITKEEAKER